MRKEKLDQHFEKLKSEEKIFFNYMHENYPLIKKSNIFLRDIEYAVKHFFELKEIKLQFEDVEYISNKFIKSLESAGKITKLDNKTWKVDQDLAEREINTKETAPEASLTES